MKGRPTGPRKLLKVNCQHRRPEVVTNVWVCTGSRGRPVFLGRLRNKTSQLYSISVSESFMNLINTAGP